MIKSKKISNDQELLQNHCHAIPANVIGVGTNYWCVNEHLCFRYSPEVHPLISKCFIGLFLFFYLFITLFQKFNTRDFQLVSVGNFPDTMYVNLHPCGRTVSAPAHVRTWGRGFESRWWPFLPEPKLCFTAQSLSCSPFHRPDTTEKLLKEP